MFRPFTAAAILALTVTAAHAADTTVYFGDLDLANPHDAHVLADRLQAAAETVCAPQKPERAADWIYYQSGYVQCIETSSRDAEETVRVSMAKTLRSKVANN